MALNLSEKVSLISKVELSNSWSTRSGVLCCRYWSARATYHIKVKGELFGYHQGVLFNIVYQVGNLGGANEFRRDWFIASLPRVLRSLT